MGAGIFKNPKDHGRPHSTNVFVSCDIKRLHDATHKKIKM